MRLCLDDRGLKFCGEKKFDATLFFCRARMRRNFRFAYSLSCRNIRRRLSCDGDDDRTHDEELMTTSLDRQTDAMLSRPPPSLLSLPPSLSSPHLVVACCGDGGGNSGGGGGGGGENVSKRSECRWRAVGRSGDDRRTRTTRKRHFLDSCPLTRQHCCRRYRRRCRDRRRFWRPCARRHSRHTFACSLILILAAHWRALGHQLFSECDVA